MSEHTDSLFPSDTVEVHLDTESLVAAGQVQDLLADLPRAERDAMLLTVMAGFLPGPAGDDRTVARVRRRRIAIVVVAGGVATLVTGGVIAAGERLVGWRAARGAAAGVRFPHTRTALVLGAANAALTLVAPQAPAEH